MTPRRQELEWAIKGHIKAGLRNDLDIALEMDLSDCYVKDIRRAAGIKFPPKPKVEKKKKIRSGQFDVTQLETGRKVEARYSLAEDRRDWI